LVALQNSLHALAPDADIHIADRETALSALH
jgi:hypothetical protein